MTDAPPQALPVAALLTPLAERILSARCEINGVGAVTLISTALEPLTSGPQAHTTRYVLDRVAAIPLHGESGANAFGVLLVAAESLGGPPD